MKKKKTNQKKLLASAAILGIILCLAGTFAWITYNDQRVNRVSTKQLADGSVSIVENWTPPTSWIPGTATPKEVQVSNTGENPVLVRVSFEEVMKSLVSKGAATTNATAYKPNATPGLTDDVPVSFNASLYTTGNGWTDITKKITNGLDDKDKVWAKGSVVYDPSTSSNKVSFEYVIFNEYATGKHQKVSGDISIQGEPAVGSAVDAWVFNDATNMAYHVYAGGYEYSMYNWAGKNTLLGTAGTRYGVAFDYTGAGTGNVTPPTQATPGTVPAANATPLEGNIQGDTGALSKSEIKIIYNALVDPGQLTGDGRLESWSYNETDGYFYYMKKLNSGEMSAQLLKQLRFNKDAGAEYTNITYDLIVKSEAIQAVPEALTDPAGWGMDTSVSDSATTKIYNELAVAITK